MNTIRLTDKQVKRLKDTVTSRMNRIQRELSESGYLVGDLMPSGTWLDSLNTEYSELEGILQRL